MRLCLEKAEVYNNSGNRFLEHEMFSNSLLPLEQHDCLHEQDSWTVSNRISERGGFVVFSLQAADHFPFYTWELF